MAELDLQAQIAELRVAFAQSIPERLEELDDSVTALEALSSETSIADIIEAYVLITRSAHKLNGTASTFGFPFVGGKAAEMEAYLEKLQNDNQNPDSQTCDKIKVFAAEIREIAIADPDVPL